MQTITRQDGLLVVKFKQGEEFFSEFTDFCKKEELSGGFFSGIGAALEVELGHYDLKELEYYFNTYDQTPIEVTNIKGNISYDSNDDYTIHAHGTIADENQEVKGGHVNKLIVGPTLEVAVFLSKDKITRAYDSETDLELLTS
ncbi:MAG: PPC domain-containing DNA-binding protein [Candidatus Magasanikbacteria bacterium]